MMINNKKNNIMERAPVVVIMGHIDHGKSTLLDYIRKTNVVDSEKGGITQNISAYEVIHKDNSGKDKKITFLDTPGHEAFSKMRARGANVADIAILVVSAEDGVKSQTIEAWKTITDNKLPVIVAINKIDKPNANVEKTKIELAEKEIYLENYGGKVPFVEISAKAGTGVNDLLSLILLVSELEELSGDLSLPASGYVIETNLDSKKGILATLIIKEGSLEKGMILATGNSICPLRTIENFKGEQISEASFSSPIRIFGFDKIPRVGESFKTFENKKDAEVCIKEWQEKNPDVKNFLDKIESSKNNKKLIPLFVKADVAGSLEAVQKEISKIKEKKDDENVEFRIIGGGIGTISESDIKNLSDAENTIAVGFNVKIDKAALETARRIGLEISLFDIIYKMTEWLEVEMEKRKPKSEVMEKTGSAKILRVFSRTKERQILGGKVTEGKMVLGSQVKIMRRDFEIGLGKIVNLDKNRTKSSTVEEGSEFGMMIESKIEIAVGDTVESFNS
jgi:translation initiation factor IF-2